MAISMQFDESSFLSDLDTFIRFETCVDENQSEFAAARAWIQAFFEPAVTAFDIFTFKGFTSLVIRPRASERPRLLGDGHIEVVPGRSGLFRLRQQGSLLFGRGVADMKTQCLMMMTVLREQLSTGQATDFWLLLSEDEEIGSIHGAMQMTELLDERGCLPEVVFVPDGGPDFAYVEKESELYAAPKTKVVYQDIERTMSLTSGKKCIIHVVKAGEFFHKIAMKYACTSNNIKKWNKLTGDLLHIGQKLKVWVPVSQTSRSSQIGLKSTT